MKTTTTIEKEDVMKWIKKLDREQLAKRNPFDKNSSACLYTDQNGCHCIVGQFLVDHDLPVPGYKQPGNSSAFSALLGYHFMSDVSFTFEAKELLIDLQRRADSSIDGHPVPVGRNNNRDTWGMAILNLLRGNI